MEGQRGDASVLHRGAHSRNVEATGERICPDSRRSIRQAPSFENSVGIHAGKDNDTQLIFGLYVGQMTSGLPSCLSSAFSMFSPSLSLLLFVLIFLPRSVNKHAEELRNYFVEHEGKKELRVEAVGSRYTVDFGRLAIQMSSQIHQHVCMLIHSFSELQYSRRYIFRSSTRPWSSGCFRISRLRLLKMLPSALFC